MDISVVPYKHKHAPLLLEILTSRDRIDMFEQEIKTLPKIGYIALIGKQPVAIGFLRRVEPCFAQIDTLASNAHFGSISRNQAIHLVVNSLMEDAKRLKLKGILAFTVDEGVLIRAKSLGFHEIDQKLIGLNLTKTQ